MVENFLEQLSAAIPSAEEVENVLRKKTKDTKKLKLRLADRTKLSNDGYALCIICLFVHIYYVMTAGLSVPAHIFSQGGWVQASYPLVKIRQRSALMID